MLNVDTLHIRRGCIIIISPSARVFEQVLAQRQRCTARAIGIIRSIASTILAVIIMIMIMIIIMINMTIMFDSIAVGPGSRGRYQVAHLMFLLDRPKHDSEVCLDSSLSFSPMMLHTKKIQIQTNHQH